MRKVFLLSSVLFLGVVACGGGGGGNGSDSLTGLSNCNQTGYDIYLGWYAEDPANNPEDPTAGYLIACIPDTNGVFSSQFLFSYSGCAGGVDIGTVSGNRTGNNISGNWTGTVDGTGIGGNFSGSWDGAKFSGNWNSSSGKVHIQIGTCEYWVAGEGTWELYALDTDRGGLSISVDVSTTPITISWNNTILGVQGFLVSVLDKQCLYDTISIADCTMWSVACPQSVNSLTYGGSGCLELSTDKPLLSNKDYLVSITAVGSTRSDVKAFASKTFTAP